MSELNDKGIEELFSDRFKDFEVDVDPSVWSNVSQSIPSASVQGGMSLLSKIIVGVSAATVVTVGTVLVMNDKDITETNRIAQRQVSTPSETVSENKQEPTTKGLTVGEEKESNPDTDIEPLSEEILEEEAISIENSLPIVEEDLVIQEVKEITKPVVVQPEIVEQKVESLTEKEPISHQAVSENEGINEETEIVTELSQTNSANKEVTLIIPNVITPNNDGDNDVYFITSEGLENFSFIILNNQQKLVFETSQPDFKWYGKAMNGDAVANGEYFYIMVAQDQDGKSVKRAGKITVRR